jgi:mannitol/fructose-specific phosphotransferase system IIA component (Ntr-type)
MKSTVNLLCQLQDLILVKDEHRATGDGAQLSRLNESIDTLMRELPSPLVSYVQRLINRDHVMMAPVHNGCCAVCGMRLPVSQIQAVRQCKAIQYCPGCARILFEDVDAPQWVGAVPSRNEPRKTGISRFSDEALMVPDMLVGNAQEAIEILAGKMESEGFISHADKLIVSAMEREATLSTAMDNHLAFPHVRSVEGGSLTLACGVSKEPFAWDSDGTPVNIVFLVTIPSAVSAFYIRLIAGLTEAFLKEANRKALISAETPKDLWKALTKATRYTIK